jgi:hypothetical protein
MRLIAIFIAFASCGSVQAQLNTTLVADEMPAPPRPSRFFPGHNLTPTSDVLSRGQAVLGTYAIGYGMTDRFTVGTSPFIIGFYNMAVIDLRYALIRDNGFQFTVEDLYFKSLPYKNLGMHDQYHQESTFLRLTASQTISSFYTLHFSSGHQYFWNSDSPYSLNPNPGQPYVLSVSTLHELHFSSHFGCFIEVGVLGLNFANAFKASDPTGIPLQKSGPYSHLGLSFFYQSDLLMVQLGVSRSQTTVYAATRQSERDFSPITERQFWYDVPMYHPELQLQFYL